MDLFGRRTKALEAELKQLTAKQAKTAVVAQERHRKVEELEKIIEDLQGEVHARKQRGASQKEVTDAERALKEAQAVHSRSSR